MPKFEAQAKEVDLILKRSGMTMEQLAEKAAIKNSTMRRFWKGHQKASALAMQSIRTAGTPASYSSALGKAERLSLKEEPLIRALRYVPVVSFAQMGDATSYEEVAFDWRDEVPTDSNDPLAFGVELKGDSMEPHFKAGEIAVVRPGSQARNGDLVIANLKNRGAIFKLFHVMDRSIFRLTSYNTVYPVVEAKEKDFHWIYPVETVVRRILRNNK